MENNKIKESIKKDLLKNIDKVVNNIYKSLNNPSFSSNLEDTSFVIEGNPYKELTISDKLTGKEQCPTSNGESNYIEVVMDEISKKIRLSEEIFTHLYNFTYKKDMTLKDIPVGITNILEVFEIHQRFQKANDSNAKSTAKWLLGITLFASIRFQNKINSPYVTSKEVKIIVKGIVKNLKNVYNVINGNSVMVDAENIGIPIFNYNFSNKNIVFIENNE